MKPFIVASHPNYPYYRHRLGEGWLFGREVVSLRLIFHEHDGKYL